MQSVIIDISWLNVFIATTLVIAAGICSLLLKLKLERELFIGVKPWYYPVYFIPIGGMIIGNSMNAIALSINIWFENLKKDRALIELYLSLGSTPIESTAKNFRSAIKAGMIPSINALMSVGVVSIPGMMTGQILAGIDPLVAIKYQIVIMLLLAGSTALSTVFALHLVRWLSFTLNQQLKV